MAINNKNNATDTVIEVQQLSRSFGAKVALQDVSLVVPRGGVYGLIGGNGAGKTTLIKHLLGLLRAQQGCVRVFGFEPTAHPVEVLGRMGYMSEDRDLPAWMTIQELMNYTQAFFPEWDERYAQELCDAFDLDKSSRVKSLSRGQRARTGLLVALAHRPELLLLDEPSSGLDPVVRRDILGAIIRTIAEEGRTVLFSSHLLDEVERVADRITMIHQGRIVMTASLDEVKESHRRVTVRFDQSLNTEPPLAGALSSERDGEAWTFIVNGNEAVWRTSAEALGGTIMAEKPLSLDEIFVSHVK